MVLALPVKLPVTFPVTLPVKLPVTFPVNEAVTVLALKLPLPSLFTKVFAVLLAVAEAVKAIRTGMCDVALAGGSSVTCPINSGHLYDDGFIKSPDGSTRSFDAEGKGTVFSDGAGVVLLKRLEEAKYGV